MSPLRIFLGFILDSTAAQRSLNWGFHCKSLLWIFATNVENEFVFGEWGTIHEALITNTLWMGLLVHIIWGTTWNAKLLTSWMFKQWIFSFILIILVMYCFWFKVIVLIFVGSIVWGEHAGRSVQHLRCDVAHGRHPQRRWSDHSYNSSLLVCLRPHSPATTNGASILVRDSGRHEFNYSQECFLDTYICIEFVWNVPIGSTLKSVHVVPGENDSFGRCLLQILAGMLPLLADIVCDFLKSFTGKCWNGILI
jgi:hypothetical protein